MFSVDVPEAKHIIYEALESDRFVPSFAVLSPNTKTKWQGQCNFGGQNRQYMPNYPCPYDVRSPDYRPRYERKGFPRNRRKIADWSDLKNIIV